MKDIILGIESSCDETCVALVAAGRELLWDELASSAATHKLFGGVVPELASRAHLHDIAPLLAQCLHKTGLSRAQLAGVAVTIGPGLVGSLLVGLSAAKVLAASLELPLIPVHHLAGHIAANYLAFPELKPPFMCLVVSGAHSNIVLVEDYCRFRLLAQTRDDAPGEAFDKLARALGLGYPGGPAIDKLARHGSSQKYKLPRTHFPDSLDFSFSGLKTATLTILQQAEQEAKRSKCSRQDVVADCDLAASFQHSLCSCLLEHCLEALETYKLRTLVLAGGVAANSSLRTLAQELCQAHGLKLYVPEVKYCTDNASMIAAQGYYDGQAGRHANFSINAFASLNLEEYYQNAVRNI